MIGNAYSGHFLDRPDGTLPIGLPTTVFPEPTIVGSR
jgi:hypothetical protein